MTYGDGDGVNFTPLVCLDVVGHEITHGVTQYSANLRYLGESGALNESFSDIFGNEVEFAKEGVPGSGTGNWRMGEDITPSGLGIRNMQNPNEFNDPDTYLGTYWVTTGSGDAGGVHTNSGVQNFWFYLLCEGGSGTNDHGNAYNVSAIGFTKAAAIAYRNLTVYLTPSSNYYAARVGAINSAIDLYGAGSPEVQAVMDAWDAVGVYAPVTPSGILVWEGVLGGGDYSGAFINTFLTSAGFTTHYTNVFPPTLIGYDAVFLSFGNFSNSSTLFDDAMASAIQTYLEAGGKVYLEGGDALGYDQSANTSIHNLFGLTSASDGTTNIIDGLAGQSDAITNGMLQLRFLTLILILLVLVLELCPLSNQVMVMWQYKMWEVMDRKHFVFHMHYHNWLMVPPPVLKMICWLGLQTSYYPLFPALLISINQMEMKFGRWVQLKKMYGAIIQ